MAKKFKESLLNDLRTQGERLGDMLWDAFQHRNYDRFAKLFGQYLDFVELYYSIFIEEERG